MAQFAHLVEMLQQELSCTEYLLGTLHDERELLESRDLAGMQALLVHKSDALNLLEKLRHNRSQWLQNQGMGQTDSRLLQELEAQQDATASAAVELLIHCRENIDKCNYFNELNGILISNSRKRNSRQLDLMRGISQEQKLYTAKGGTERRTSQTQVGRA
ncbi:MAG: flagellar protein FlgN [Proteobacteria bacterium]|nr:flagellar protein FlgN [Pseudomonadota bacterium]